MASTNTPTSLVGDFKNLYQESGLVEAIPTWAIVQDRFNFEEAQSTGQYYVFGVILQKEQGATYAPSSGTGSGAVTLNASIAGFVGQALVEGYAIYMRSRLSYDAAAKASRAGKKAFAQAYGAVLKNLKESHQYRLECSLLYGRVGLGVVSTNTTGALVLTNATWATGIWAAGLKDAILEAFDSTAVTANQLNGDLTISAIDVANKTVTVTGTSSSVVATNILYFKGARTTTAWNEAPGLDSIMQNNGTLFNISALSYDSWHSQSYNVGGNLSMTAILQAASVGMSYGLEKGILFVAPEKFAQLGLDEAALRRYVNDSDAKNTNRGVRGVEFMLGPVSIEVMAHPLVKQGTPLLVPSNYTRRTGATDITFALPGTDEPLSVQVVDTTSMELRTMSDMSMFMEKPAQAVRLFGVT